MQMKPLWRNLASNRAIKKRVPATTGIGFTSVDDGIEDFWFDVYISESMVYAMGQQAARNASQRSKDGALEVRITQRKKRK